MWYNEVEDEFVELDTVLDEENSTVSVETEHFSKYMLVDQVEWFKAWKNASLYFEDTYEPLASVICYDCSSSMSSNDRTFNYNIYNEDGTIDYSYPTCYRKLAIDNFIDSMTMTDITALVSFESSAKLVSGFSSDNDVLKSLVKPYNGGGTNARAALDIAISQLETVEHWYSRHVVLLSDGDVNITVDQILEARTAGIEIHTIGLGSGANNQKLQNCARDTGGQFFAAKTAEELDAIYRDLSQNNHFDLEGLPDEDEDGLPDEFEVSGLVISNAQVVFTYPENPDCDDDDLLDGEEITSVNPKITVKENLESQETFTCVVFNYCSDPNREDTDGDGLYDGQVRKNSDGDVIAPIDPDPKNYNGLENMWNNHIYNVEHNSIPNQLVGWYGYDGSDYENTGVEGFAVLADELNLLFNESKDSIDKTDFEKYIKKAIKYAVNKPEMATNYFNMAIDELEKCFPSDKIKEIETELGSSFLNFKEDYNHVLHSQFNQWQAIGGYNNTYDFMFRTFTDQNMDNEKFAFTVDDTEYIFWIWRGDYLNLGAGSEIGIYSRPSWFSQDPDKIDHYFVDTDLSMPMELYLYNYENSDDIENIFSWEPTTNQWWITGFNPEYVGNVDVHKQVMVGTVDLSDKIEMFNCLKNLADNSNENKYNYLYFDKNTYKLWIMWGDENVVIK